MLACRGPRVEGTIYRCLRPLCISAPKSGSCEEFQSRSHTELLYSFGSTPLPFLFLYPRIPAGDFIYKMGLAGQKKYASLRTSASIQVLTAAAGATKFQPIPTIPTGQSQKITTAPDSSPNQAGSQASSSVPRMRTTPNTTPPPTPRTSASFCERTMPVLEQSRERAMLRRSD